MPVQSPEYYKSLGLKCGIEIHRQLEAGKLFCRCRTTMQEKPSGEVFRRLRPVAGELGALDPAALHEALQKKEFLYKIYPKESCLVELDEEPPHEPDYDAFEASLLVSLQLRARVPDEVHFMRKTVIDGSNTSGFQRTAIVGFDGYLDVSFGRVGITNISLEEESAQILEKQDGKTVFGLNRLGIPLVEIGTSPDITTPEQAREVAEKIGMLLRSTGRVKRGLGTIRQDINVSIANGARVEIKGAQDLCMIPEIVAEEAERQKSLVALVQEAGKRKIQAQSPKIFSANDILSKAQSKILAGKDSFGIILHGFAGLFKTPLNQHRTLGKEVAGYAKAKAGVAGIIHTDEDLSKYGAENEFRALCEKRGTKPSDLVVVVAAPEKTAKAALDAVVERVNLIFSGVPKETRRALADGDTEYMRPLPGAARMYPETDVLPISVTPQMLLDIGKKMPESPEEKIARFTGLGLNKELAGQIADSDFLPVFESALALKIPARDVANVFLNVIPDLKARESVDATNLPSEKFLEIFSLVEKQKISKDAIPLVLSALAKSPQKSAQDIARELGLSVIGTDEARKIIKKIIAEEKNKNVGYLTGKCIQLLKGKIENRIIAEIVKEEARKTA